MHKISNDFNKAVLHIVHKWIHLTHNYMTKREMFLFAKNV